jgi:hypothetical protein
MRIHEGDLINGQELYTLYREKFKLRGYETDDWNDLEEDNKQVWNALAEDLLLWKETL